MLSVEAVLRATMRKLRKELPTVWPVRVRRRSDLAKDCYGTCSLVLPDEGRPYFSIILDDAMPAGHARMTLMHEYAHALSWTEAHPTISDHDPEFGLAYSRVYKAVMDD
jgi:hypothetical protein